MNAATLNIIRWSVTGAIAGFSTGYAYYPHAIWIPVVLAVLGTIGVHLVPANGQAIGTDDH